MPSSTEKNKASQNTSGWLNGIIGMIIFSGSLPATKMAILYFHPIFLTATRATVAGLIAGGALLFYKQKWPGLSNLFSLTIVASGCVIGFPLLSAMALEYSTSARNLIFVALLPLVTAIFAVIRGGERPSWIFWLFAILGSLLVMGYAFAQGTKTSLEGDSLMLMAIIVCGLGYAEGAKLAKIIGAWQVISWTLVLLLVPMAIMAVWEFPGQLAEVTAMSWMGLGYTAIFSMYIGFVFWYRGLAEGGIAKIGQLQLLQPFLGLILAALILHETVNMSMLIVMVGVIFCVAGSKRFS